MAQPPLSILKVNGKIVFFREMMSGRGKDKTGAPPVQGLLEHITSPTHTPDRHVSPLYAELFVTIYCQGTHCTREKRENGPKNSLSGKTQGIWKFCQNAGKIWFKK